MSELPSPLNFDRQIDQILSGLQERPNTYLMAIVGIPGSGKSTLCDAIVKRLPGSVVLPMDRVRNRLVACGITSTLFHAAQQVESNDLLNARLIIEDGAEERANLTLC